MRNKNYLKIISKSFCIAIGIFFILVSLYSVFRPYTLELMKKDVTIKVVANGSYNKEALDDNVRISNIAVNGNSINMSTLPIDEGSQWKYDSKNDFLYVYEYSGDEVLTINRKDVYSLTISFVSELGSGVADLYIDDELIDRIDLYSEEKWSELEYDYETTPLVYPETHFGMYVGTVSVLWAICFVYLLLFKLPVGIKEYFIKTAQIGLLSVVTLTVILIVQYTNFTKIAEVVSEQHQSFLKAFVLIFLVMQTLTLLTKRVWIGFSVVSLLVFILNIVSKIKLLNRGVPLLPWDFMLIKETVSVIGTYEISLSVTDIISFIMIIMLTVMFILCKAKINSHIVLRLGLALVCLSMSSLFIYNSFIHPGTAQDGSNLRVYQVDKYYEKNGFLTAFVDFFAYLKTSEAPEDYSRETMEKIVEELKTDEESKGNTPTIIAVMSESFWNIDRVDTLNFNEDVFPTFNSLKNESTYGELFSHVLGGGTVMSEFEFLTGFSALYFPKDYMIYGSAMSDNFNSSVSMLKEQGYTTVAMHPYLSTNYNRETAYQKYGFDKCYFEDDFEKKNLVRNYVSDQELFEKVIEEYESNADSGKPQYIFSITMQNHGGYWEETIYEEGKVDFTTEAYGETATNAIVDFVSGLHESDRALGELIDYFREVDEEVIVVYFGDHVSDAGPKDDRMLAKTSWASDWNVNNYQTHRVPFLVWTNTESESKDLGMMEISELLPYVFDEYGIKSNSFWNYIHNSGASYAASGFGLVINSVDNYTDVANMTAEQSEFYKTYELLQYDYIYGKRYAIELWE